MAEGEIIAVTKISRRTKSSPSLPCALAPVTQISVLGSLERAHVSPPNDLARAAHESTNNSEKEEKTGRTETPRNQGPLPDDGTSAERARARRSSAMEALRGTSDGRGAAAAMADREVARVSRTSCTPAPPRSLPRIRCALRGRGLRKAGRGQRVRGSEVCVVPVACVCACESDLLLRVAVSVCVFELFSWEAFLFAAVGRWECKKLPACLFLVRVA